MIVKINTLLQDSQKNEEKKLEKELKEYARISERTKEKPFHEKNILFFYIALITMFFCPIISIITESSLVYTGCFMLLENLPLYSREIALLCTILVIGAMEAIQILLLGSYYKKRVANGGHTSDMNNNLYSLFFLGLVLTTLSFAGSFDLFRLVSNKPVLEVYASVTEQDINRQYDPVIAEKRRLSQEFFQKNSYKGKLDSRRAKDQKALDDKYLSSLEGKQNALLHLNERNEKESQKIEQRNQKKTYTFQNKMQKRGSMLGFVTIVCIFLAHFSTFYKHKFLYQKAAYLSKKYPAPFLEQEYMITGQGQIEPIVQFPPQQKNKPQQAASNNGLDSLAKAIKANATLLSQLNNKLTTEQRTEVKGFKNKPETNKPVLKNNSSNGGETIEKKQAKSLVKQGFQAKTTTVSKNNPKEETRIFDLRYMKQLCRLAYMRMNTQKDTTTPKKNFLELSEILKEEGYTITPKPKEGNPYFIEIKKG